MTQIASEVLYPEPRIKGRGASFHLKRAPSGADPDVLRLSAHLSIRYSKAKMLKALSYGIAVEAELLQWCRADDEIERPIGTDIGEIRTATGLNIECLHLSLAHTAYVMRDQAELAVIRRIMNGGEI